MQRVPSPVWLPPSTTRPNQVLLSTGVGSNVKWGSVTTTAATTTGGGSGITQLTGDVTAGPGSGSVASYLDLIQGITLQASGAYAPTNGMFLAYGTAVSSSWRPMGGTPTLGSQLYWNNLAWTSSPSPTTNAQVMIWNSSTSAWVPKTLSQDVSITNAGVTNVDKLQNTTLSVSGSYAPTTGQILSYSTAFGNQWNPMGGTPTTGSMLWWNNIAWTSTPTISSGQVWKWNGSAYTASTPLFSGDTAGGDLSGTYPNPTIGKLQGNTLSVSGSYAPSASSIMAYSTAIGSQWLPMAGGATTGQVPSWNGLAWAATTMSGGGITNTAWSISSSSGSATSISGFTNYLIMLNGNGTRGAAGPLTATFGIGASAPGTTFLTASTYGATINQLYSATAMALYTPGGSFTAQPPVVNYLTGSATVIIIGLN